MSWKVVGLGLEVAPHTLKLGLEVAAIFSAIDVKDEREDNLFTARLP
jgi:hypothetical protein